MCKFIMFAGSTERRAQLEAMLAGSEWHLYEAFEHPVMGALAQVVMLMPDVAILEDDDAAQEVYLHLETILYTPILVLTDFDDAFLMYPAALTLPRDASGETLLAALNALIDNDAPILMA